MEFNKVEKVLDGVAKMFTDAKLKAEIVAMKGQLSRDWEKLAGWQQQDIYRKSCELFLKASKKCLAVMK